MTPRRWAFTYLATAASMAALGAATAVAVVALEERATKRLGGDDPDPVIDAIIHCPNCDCGPDDENTDPAILNAHFEAGMNAYVDEMEAADRRATPDRRDPLANSVRCDTGCTCHGQYGETHGGRG